MTRQLAILAAAGAMAATTALAQTNPTPPPTPATAKGGIQARLRRQMIKALDLTPAQKQQAKTIQQATKAQVQPLAQQLKENRQSLTAAIQAGDTAKIQQLSTTAGTLRGQILALRSAGMAQFYAILTPDQKAKAADFQQKAKQLLGGRG